MKLRSVNNPSYNHSKEIVDYFKKYSISFYNKDYTSYNTYKANFFITVAKELKKLKINSETIRQFTRILENENYEYSEKNYRKLEFIFNEKLINLITEYWMNRKIVRNIGLIQSIEELDMVLKNESKTNLMYLNIRDFDMVYEDNIFQVIMPRTIPAAIYFGKDTKWCISAEKADNKFVFFFGGENYFTNAMPFLILNKKSSPRKDKLAKICIMIINNELVFSDSFADDLERGTEIAEYIYNILEFPITEDEKNITVDALNEDIGFSEFVEYISERANIKAILKAITDYYKKVKTHPLVNFIGGLAKDYKFFIKYNKFLEDKYMNSDDDGLPNTELYEYWIAILEYEYVDKEIIDHMIYSIQEEYRVVTTFDVIEKLIRHNGFKNEHAISLMDDLDLSKAELGEIMDNEFLDNDVREMATERHNRKK